MNGAVSSSSNPSGVQGIYPDCWHLPSDLEWTELINYLGGESVAGGKMKETGTTHWSFPNTGATNSSGFTALPGGDRISNGDFAYLFNLGGFATFWSSTENDSSIAWNRDMSYSGSVVHHHYNYKDHGMSVRCVRD